MISARAPNAPPLIQPFDYRPRTRLVFGVNCVEQVGELARELGARHVLVVTDPGIAKAGHAARVEDLIRKCGLTVHVFDQVRQNPTTRDVSQCRDAAQSSRIDLLIGLGGGSAMDTAKGCNFLLTNGGRMQDYWGVGKATKPMLPFIAIPTTAGTGSECQCAALIADEETHRKMACLDPKAAARIALLDPALTISQPMHVTAHTGIDAVAHAVETAVTTKRTTLSLMFSHESFKLAISSLPRVLAEPADLHARGQMLLAAALAGTAIENSMLGAAHAAANPLTSHFGIVHGAAVGMMLPAVVRFNAQNLEARHAYAELASAPEIACVSDGLDEAVDALVARLEALLNQAQIARSLGEFGASPSHIPKLAQDAAAKRTARFNPRPLSVGDFEQLYTSASAIRSRGDAGRT